MKRILSLVILVAILACSLLSSCSPPDASDGNISLDTIPAFSDKAYVKINNNIPSFTNEEKASTKSYEFYSELDALGRCGYTMACIGTDIMPTEDRGSIGQVKPSGWQTVRYDIVDAKYLYNRCHLIGFQLTGENANVKNLITGTRYLNIEGMLPFENLIADYLKENPKNHVLYRSTPIYEGYNLVASGVHMEAYSLEDDGEGVSFNVYAYNAQPGVIINYANGMSRLATEDEWNGKLPSDTESAKPEKPTENDIFTLNTKSKKIHTTVCRYADNLTEQCKGTDLGVYKAQGYTLCGSCDPMPDEAWEDIAPSCTECKDENDNSKCDVCGIDFSDKCDLTDCRDENDDEKCDNCGFDFSDKCDLTDCRDENDDEKCDNCGFDFSDSCDAEHKDTNDDGKCDFGGEDFDDGEETNTYVINTESKKIHKSTCRYAQNPDGVKYVEFTGTESELHEAYPEEDGYTACGTCKPFN